MTYNNVAKKGLTVGIIILFIGTCVIPAIAKDTEKPFLPSSRGNWLYVGGSGPGNYSRIQDAINNSLPGYTIYVYNGTYYETIKVNVENLTLVGENRENTIINSKPIPTAIDIIKNKVNISGFTVIADPNWIYGNCIFFNDGVQACRISNNNLSGTPRGVNIGYANDYHIIENNLFHSNENDGIEFNDNGHGNCIIRNNSFVDDTTGILIYGGTDLEIENNTFTNCQSYAIYLCSFSTIKNNVFDHNKIAMNDYGSCHITNNIFNQNNRGIDAYGGNDDVENNSFINNYVGVSYDFAVLKNNKFINNGIIPGMLNNNPIIENNTINGKPIVFYADKSDVDITDAGEVLLLDCSNVEIKEINFPISSLGVYLDNIKNCLISSCSFKNNSEGIEMRKSNNVTISGCTFSINGEGINDYYSTTNVTTCNFLSGPISYTLNYNQIGKIRLSHNYYGGLKIIKIIPGTIQTRFTYEFMNHRYPIFRPGFLFDFHPAREPYDMPGMT